ncbi:carboxypeptidase-like regulatory domain-containing protein [Anatilimnocola sp. NA78]|uniref:carboxypeptidase-like regulatory domain-containing protein n=1 Tax=Anatilimnocola sp. NA78 TaxID=3415683 RepID=UPI003CE4CFFA
MTKGLATAFALLALSLSVGLTGCGGPNLSENLVPVTGTVTMDGKPLAGASVTFVAIGTTPGMGGVGTVDESGKFEVSHFRAGKGLDPGEYKVVISKRVMSNGSPIPAGTLSIADLSTRDIVPPRYSDYNKTTLALAVSAGGQPLTFALTSR